jgi:hypothetical protein
VAEIGFRLLPNSLIVIPVVVDGRWPFDFVRDTGTETLLIDSGLARQLNLNSDDRLIVDTPNGYDNVSRALIAAVLVGRAAAAHRELLVNHLEAFNSADSSIREMILT